MSAARELADAAERERRIPYPHAWPRMSAQERRAWRAGYDTEQAGRTLPTEDALAEVIADAEAVPSFPRPPGAPLSEPDRRAARAVLALMAEQPTVAQVRDEFPAWVAGWAAQIDRAAGERIAQALLAEGEDVWPTHYADGLRHAAAIAREATS